MKMKSIPVLMLSGLLAISLSAPLFADDSSNSTDNGTTTNSDQSSSDMDDSNKSDSGSKPASEGASEDTATGDDDY